MCLLLSVCLCTILVYAHFHKFSHKVLAIQHICSSILKLLYESKFTGYIGSLRYCKSRKFRERPFMLQRRRTFWMESESLETSLGPCLRTDVEWKYWFHNVSSFIRGVNDVFWLVKFNRRENMLICSIQLWFYLTVSSLASRKLIVKIAFLVPSLYTFKFNYFLNIFQIFQLLYFKIFLQGLVLPAN